ncbi:MAG: 3-deoxy-D-manno-octulosonic acid transferase [Desulfatibacillum sp.]|nr:3-deoxy-D-manno-octulosonic acid transferase [Desulfatibacillum sp.]
MNLAYSLAMEGLFLYGVPLYWAYSRLVSRRPKDFSQRLGIYPAATRTLAKGAPRIWIHASSVGEVGVAKAISDALENISPEFGLVVSTGTFFGRERAFNLFGEKAPCVYAPLDFKAPVQKAMRWFRPNVLVLLETELWPQWIFQSGKMGIPIILANGRISSRSVGSYLRFKPLFSKALETIAAFSMIGPDDARRIKLMGAPPGRVEVNGNAKYDFLASQAHSEMEAQVRALLQHQDGPVIVAGSTRRGEEEAVLDMFVRVRKQHPHARLVLAPRHIERAKGIVCLLKSRSLEYDPLSSILQQASPSNAPVLLVDLMGHLLNLYSLADVVFCGGSLVDLGGQNVLEPASWGKPVLYGPHMDDFTEARDLLESEGGGRTVKNPEDLARQVMELLADPEKARSMGDKALACVQTRRGAAEKHARVIRRFIG